MIRLEFATKDLEEEITTSYFKRKEDFLQAINKLCESNDDEQTVFQIAITYKDKHGGYFMPADIYTHNDTVNIIHFVENHPYIDAKEVEAVSLFLWKDYNSAFAFALDLLSETTNLADPYD